MEVRAPEELELDVVRIAEGQHCVSGVSRVGDARVGDAESIEVARPRHASRVSSARRHQTSAPDLLSGLPTLVQTRGLSPTRPGASAHTSERLSIYRDLEWVNRQALAGPDELIAG